MQLIVLGMHRSGTSVLARILNLMGAYFGPEDASTGASTENPKGFWERRDVRDLNDMVLQSAGCDWNRVLKFDLAAVPESVLADFNKRAGRLVLGMDMQRPWFMKEPRLCMLFPLWRQFLEVPVCIHIVRHPIEVAASLRTRNETPIEAGLALWEYYVRAAIQASTGLPELVVSHRQLMEEPRRATARLLAELQETGVHHLRTPSDREIDAFVSAELYRERESRPDLAGYVNSPQVQLFQRLLGGGDLSPVRSGKLSPETSKALAMYESGLPPLQVRSKPKPPMPEPERVLREQLAAKSQEVQLVREQAKGAAQELKRQNEERMTLERELGKMRHESLHMSQDLKEGKSRLATLEAELQSLHEESIRLSEGLSGSEQKRAGLLQRVERMAAEVKEAQNARLASEAEASERFGEIEMLTRLLMEGERLYMQRDEAATHAQARERALEAALTAAKVGQERLQAEVRTRSDAAAKASGEINRLREEREALRRQIGRLVLSAASSVKRLDEMSHRLRAAHADLGWRAGAPLRVLRGKRAAEASTSEDADGELEAIRLSGLFDAQWYLQTYPDVEANGIDPAKHYLAHGAYEGRDPGPNFDTGYYLSRNMDVAASGANPLLHYVRYGKSEGRKAEGAKDGND